MSVKRVVNFSAGPSVLFEEVLREVGDNILSYKGMGLSAAEMSHRSNEYVDIHRECKALLYELMNIPDTYDVLLLQGGGQMQFDAVPLNLMVKGKADYVTTGHWANMAIQYARQYGDIYEVANSEDKNHSYIPDLPESAFRPDTDYVHITTNNTIFGTRYTVLPKTPSPLVADMSSNILSEEMDVTKFGIIYAGAQKNIGPSGVTVVIIRKDLIGLTHSTMHCPKMLRYDVHAKAESIYNTPPCMGVYMAMVSLQHLKKIGGVKAIQKVNEDKAQMLYDFIDNSSFYTNNVVLKDRSIMNVPFVTPSKDLDKEFLAQAQVQGMINLAGHKVLGGMRASIYNAMPVAGVKKLIEFMKEFEMKNK